MGGERSWHLLEKVLARTCDAWQVLDAEEQQLARLRNEVSMLNAAVALEWQP